MNERGGADASTTALIRGSRSIRLEQRKPAGRRVGSRAGSNDAIAPPSMLTQMWVSEVSPIEGERNPSIGSQESGKS